MISRRGFLRQSGIAAALVSPVGALAGSPFFNRQCALLALFQPRYVGGLVGDWGAYDPGYRTLNGSGISALKDRSGLGHDLLQATAANQPTIQPASLNGLATILFDGVDDFLKTAAFTLNQPTFVALVGKVNSWVYAHRILDGGSAGNLSITMEPNTANKVGIYVTGGAGIVGATLPISTWAYLSGTFSGASSSFSINRTSTTGTVGTSAAGGITLGAYADGTFNGSIQVARVLVYNRIPSQSEQDYLLTGLATQWGLAI